MGDPLSILGAAVGVTSLALQITDECIRIFNVYNRAVNMPEVYRYVQVRMQIEQHRFLNFSFEAGMLQQEADLSTSLRLNRSLLIAVLAEIKTLFETYARKYGKYENMRESSATKADGIGDEDSALMELLTYDPMDDDRTKDDRTSMSQKPHRSRPLWKFGTKIAQSGRNLRIVVSEPRRLVWGLVDKDSFEGLVTRLENLNSLLINLLDSSQTRRLQDTMQITYQEVLQVRNDIGSLRNLVMALSSIKNRSAGLNMDLDAYTSTYPVESYWREIASLQELAEVKIQYAQTEYLEKTTESAIQALADTQLDIHDFTFSKVTNNMKSREERTNATYQNTSVWIEWKELNNISPSLKTIKTRIGLLTRFLLFEKPTGFRAPSCVGYVEALSEDGEVRLGIVYRKEHKEHSELWTLRNLLTSHDKPSLSDRVVCCAVLARSLYSFHAINWLHKGLRASNILFFLPDLQHLRLVEPYVSGFELSRPSFGENLTEKPDFDSSKEMYRHPNAQVGRNDGHYQRYYDLYSLGVILVEVALWMPIHVILGYHDANKMAPSVLQNILPWLLGQEQSENGLIAAPSQQSCLQSIAAECGDVFRDVIHSCLTADQIARPRYSGEPEAALALRLQIFMQEEVVGKLESLAAALRSSRPNPV